MDHILLGCVIGREAWSIVLEKLHLDSSIVVHQETSSPGGCTPGNGYGRWHVEVLTHWPHQLDDLEGAE